MAFKDDLKRSLGAPLFDVELHDTTSGDNDYKYIERRVLRRINEFIPYQVILVKTDIPVNASGNLDLSDDNIFAVTNAYLVGRKQQMTAEAAIAWTTLYSQANIINTLWPSNMPATDYALYKNELHNMRKTYNSDFNWKYDTTVSKLYLQNVPSWATGVGVEAYRFIDSLDDVDDRYLYYDIALDYAEGLAMQMIGRKFSKYKHDGLELPGSDYISQGLERITKAEEDMHNQAPWPGGLSS